MIAFYNADGSADIRGSAGVAKRARLRRNASQMPSGLVPARVRTPSPAVFKMALCHLPLCSLSCEKVVGIPPAVFKMAL